jgi:hypothetical protein
MKKKQNKRKEFQEFPKSDFERMFDNKSIVTERRLEQKENWFGWA